MSLEGKKLDTGKDRWDLLPYDAIEEVVKVLSFGASKYSDRNWEKGISHTRLFAACMRHLTSWLRGQDKDPETGLSHLAHAVCCILFVLAFKLRDNRGEDRPGIAQEAPPEVEATKPEVQRRQGIYAGLDPYDTKSWVIPCGTFEVRKSNGY